MKVCWVELVSWQLVGALAMSHSAPELGDGNTSRLADELLISASAGMH